VKVLTFVADALESAVTSLRTPAANDPVGAPAPAASEKLAPSATEMQAPASAALVLDGDVAGRFGFSTGSSSWRLYAHNTRRGRRPGRIQYGETFRNGQFQNR
jgi:hypothetical protein